ncbi:MAG: hypothetical protein K2J20_01845, partial [Bacilli bacterium]|nr:hypothetical protein [Bacilli bacterium]
MKKKIIYLVFLLFLTSGCSIEYNLEIDGSNIYHEDFTVNATVSENFTQEDLLSKYNEEYPIYIDEEFMYY